MLRFGIVAVAIFFAMKPLIATADCDRVFTMSHSGDYVPYQYQDAKGDLVGLDVDIVNAVMAEMGCKVEVRLIPPKRAQRMLLTGSLDLMAAASITPERQEYAYFSKAYRDERVVMFVHRERYNELRDLTLVEAVNQKRRIVAGVGGWYGVEYGSIMDRALAEGVLELNTSTDQRIRMLMAKRMEIVVADLYVGYHHAIDQGHGADIIELPHVLNSDPVHFMLSRKTHNAQDVGAFNTALAAVMASARYDDLILDYMPTGKSLTD